MAIGILCPCGVKLTVNGGTPGQEIECVSCGQSLRIPEPGQVQQRAQPRPQVQVQQPAQPRPQVQAQPRPRPQVQAAPAQVRQRAVPQTTYADDALPPLPSPKRWPVFAGFAAMLLAVGGVYYVMNQRVNDLEKALNVTAEEGLASAEEARTLLADEQKRASDEEADLRGRVEEQEKARQALTSELRSVSRASDDLRGKIDTEIARHDKALQEAKRRGAATARMVDQHETLLQGLRGDLQKSLTRQGELEKKLEAVTEDLDDLKKEFIAAAKESALLAARVKLGDDTLRASLDAQKKKVDRLTAQLGRATGSAQTRIKQDLAKAQRELRALKTKVAAAPRRDPALIALRNKVRALEARGLRNALNADPSTSVAVGFRATGNLAAVASCNTATGQTELTLFSPLGTMRTGITDFPALKVRGSTAGRFEVHALLDKNGDFDEFVRLDTQTGALWRNEINGGTTWLAIGFFQGRRGPNGTYRLDPSDSRARSNSAIILTPSFKDKAILVLSDTRTGGKTFTDWFAPRLVMLQ